jgi:hypothetical protein
MKFAVGLGVGFVVLMAEIFAIATLIVAPALPPNGRIAIDQYLRYERARLGTDLTVTQMVHATRPWLFTAAASSETFSDGYYYDTSRSYESEPATLDPGVTWLVPGTATQESSPAWTISQTVSSVWPNSGRRALPYPPKEVWCVVLKGREPGVRVIFAALHSDLCNADWIVHEPNGKAASPELAATLSEIGCDLER